MQIDDFYLTNYSEKNENTTINSKQFSYFNENSEEQYGEK
jgi:hypothetical protein